MQISADLSLYPLTPDYEAPIIDFIKELGRQPGVRLATNGLATQVTGEYDAVMDGLKTAMYPTLAGDVTCSFVVKILNVAIEPGEAVSI